MSENTTNTIIADPETANEEKFNSRKVRHTNIPPKSPERDAVVMLYRCRMISVKQACDLIGIKRTAFYAMLQSRYGFSDGAFNIMKDEDAKSIVDTYIRRMGNDQCVAASSLMHWLEMYTDEENIHTEDIESPKATPASALTHEDLMVLDHEFRVKAIKQIFEEGIRQGREGAPSDFEPVEWLQQEIKPENTNDAMTEAFLSRHKLLAE